MRLLAVAPYGLDQIDLGGPFLDGRVPDHRPAAPGGWSAVPAFPNLVFTNALGITSVPGTTKLVVWEREGGVWLFDNDPATSTKTKILDVSDHCQGWSGGGLLGLAFHPGFATNHYVFIYYTWVAPGTVTGGPNSLPLHYLLGGYRDRLARFTLDSNFAAVPDSETVFVDQITSSLWHDGGGLFFHPDNGFLYWSDGDDEAGWGGGTSQTITTDLLSGVFRIDVDQRGGGVSHPIPRQPANGTTANYYIPNDNPFAGQPGVLEEYFALGLRSPHRMTLDPVSGRIFIGDVGENTWEEIDVIEPSDPPGLNFQWVDVEGTLGDLLTPYIGASKGPTLEYGHDEGVCVIGGYVYRGREFAAELGGRYIFGDNGNGSIWMMDETTDPPGKELLCRIPASASLNPTFDNNSISSFGTGANGELYICQLGNSGGGIYKLSHTASQAPPRQFPSLLSETGAFASTASLQPSAALLPYGVNSPLWSDGAGKSRWAALPSGQVIYNATNGWYFPPGTVFVKHFDLAVDETDPSALRRRLETRLTVVGTNGSVFGAAYKWRPDNSDADLLTNKLDEEILIKTSAGVRTQVWHYPSPDECLRCHNAASGGVLGASVRQLNGSYLYSSGLADNQLRTWNHLGLLYPVMDEAAIAGMDQLVSITNTAANLLLRVRSYLDSNCAFCHQPGGSPAAWDGRIGTPFDTAGIVNGPVSQSLGLPVAKVVAPGAPERSVLFARASSTDASIRMPPLARNLVDNAALTAIGEWIRSLAASNDIVAAPWYHEDIGGAVPRGGASYAGDALSITAGGPDIQYAADSFHFVYQPLAGDGELSARLDSVADAGFPWTKAGLMIRESLSPSARHMVLFIAPSLYPGVVYRTTAFTYSNLSFWSQVSLPYWLKVARSGDQLTGYISPDGSSWSPIFAMTAANFSHDAYIGFAAASSTTAQTTQAKFEQIRVGGSVRRMNYPPSIDLLEPAGEAVSILPASVAISASASDTDGSIAKVEFYDGIEKLAEAAAAPYTYIWTNPPVGIHAISAHAIDDLGAVVSSPPASVTVAAIILDSPEINAANGQVQLAFTGLKGATYILERSSDLRVWTPISTNVMSDLQVSVTDVAAPATKRFYRVRGAQ